MWHVVGTLAAIILILVLFEMLDLPDWIGRKLRGEPPEEKKMEDRIRSLESRLEDLEKNRKATDR